jgi:hypothetical protein
MALMLLKSGAYLCGGALLVWLTEAHPWASYLLGCWCGANAMNYIIGWAMGRVEMARAMRQQKAAMHAQVVDFVNRRTTNGTTTH